MPWNCWCQQLFVYCIGIVLFIDSLLFKLNRIIRDRWIYSLRFANNFVHLLNMTRIIKFAFCLIFLSGLNIPPAAGKCQFLKPVFEINYTIRAELSCSLKQETIHPRKKVKKKRTTILNRKHKMRNGHSCPSF